MLGTKMKTEEAHSSICVDTERKQGDKHCKGKRVREAKKNGENVGCADVTQTLLHTGARTQKTLYTETFWHTDVFTHTHTRARSYTQTLLHPNTFTHGRFYTQRRLHRGSVTHRNAQKPLHTDAVTHICVDTTKLAQSTSPALLRTTVYGGKRGREGGNKGGQKRGGGRPSTTCTTKFAEKCQYYPVLLCIAKFGQITSSTTYYFVFQSLQKVFPSTILRTIKLVQEARRGESGRGATSTTSYYKVCTK